MTFAGLLILAFGFSLMTLASIPAVSRKIKGAALRRGRRSAYVTRDLTTGSIPKNLVFLAWPIIGSSIFRVVELLADLLWAGLGFGTAAIAGVGTAQMWVQISMGSRRGLDTSVRAMVSRAVGANNLPLANHVALQGLTLNAAVSLVIALIGLLLTPQLMRLVGVGDEVVAEATPYMRIQFVALAIAAMTQMSSAIFQASGDSLTPFRIEIFSRVSHLVLSPLLIFGWGIPGFSGMGIAGAAVSNALTGALGLSYLMYILFTGKSRMHLTFSGYTIDLHTVGRMVRLGLPASANNLERTLGDLVLFLFVAPFGTVTVAAYILAHRTHQVVNFAAGGTGQASGVIVGQSLGADRPQRARQTVIWAVAIVTYVALITGSFVIVFPQVVLSIFNPSPALLEVATVWLRIQAVGFIVVAPSRVFNQSFSTAGDTLTPMLVTLLTVWGVQQPLAYFLPRITDLGEYGVAIAPVIAQFSRNLIYFPYFFWGPWLRKQVV